MARSKEFDPERALNKAMHLFWRRGYENTSVGELLRAMGIAKQSLYDTFGDKWRHAANARPNPIHQGWFREAPLWFGCRNERTTPTGMPAAQRQLATGGQ